MCDQINIFHKKERYATKHRYPSLGQACFSRKHTLARLKRHFLLQWIPYPDSFLEVGNEFGVPVLAFLSFRPPPVGGQKAI